MVRLWTRYINRMRSCNLSHVLRTIFCLTKCSSHDFSKIGLIGCCWTNQLLWNRRGSLPLLLIFCPFTPRMLCLNLLCLMCNRHMCSWSLGKDIQILYKRWINCLPRLIKSLRSHHWLKFKILVCYRACQDRWCRKARH